jgi:ABC-type nitrate/sulfonate/bicarbonate transport system substrate-binding protein
MTMRLIGILLATLALAVAGCGSAAVTGGGKAKTVTIAYQPGIGYAPLLIMKQQKTLEKALPGKKIVYKRLDSGSAIRDGMLSGDINVGSGGLGPFLVGWDKGIDWKVLTPMEDMDLWLMTKSPKYKTLADFKSGGKIAMPAPDSVQAIVLAKGAQEQLGDAKALDKNIVSLGHPDGLQALLSGQLAGHLTSPPFEFDEQDKGAREVLSSYKVFGGPHTFNSVFMRQGFYNDNKDVSDAIFKGVQQSIQMLRDDPAKAADLLSKESGGQNSAAQFKGYITHQGVQYTDTPHGFLKFAQFMKQIGLTDEAPSNVDDLTFDQLHGMSGAN